MENTMYKGSRHSSLIDATSNSRHHPGLALVYWFSESYFWFPHKSIPTWPRGCIACAFYNLSIVLAILFNVYVPFFLLSELAISSNLCK